MRPPKRPQMGVVHPTKPLARCEHGASRGEPPPFGRLHPFSQSSRNSFRSMLVQSQFFSSRLTSPDHPHAVARAARDRMVYPSKPTLAASMGFRAVNHPHADARATIDRGHSPLSVRKKIVCVHIYVWKIRVSTFWGSTILTLTVLDPKNKTHTCL